MNPSKNTFFVYKTREENMLRASLVQSGLVTQEQLSYIKKLYHESVAYHNFLHALKVAESVLKLPTKNYTMIELRSLFFAALFHDAGHTGSAEILDEFRSLDMAFQGIVDFEKRYDIEVLNYSIIRKAIIGTVFKNRAKNKDSFAILLADLDIATIGMSFPAFLYYCDFPICIEFGKEIEQWLLDVKYFKFLMSVEKNIFRTPLLRVLFPEYFQNIKKYTSTHHTSLSLLFDIWYKTDLSFQEFENIYKNTFSER